MNRSLYLLAALFVAFAAAAHAQVQPQPGNGDPHLQQVDYDVGRIVQLRGAPGYQLMIELSPDEQVQSVGMGDSSAWQVSVSKDGTRLFLKPVQPGVMTNMAVVTTVRDYNFDLESMMGPMPDMPYTVQFRYPATTPRIDPAAAYIDVAAIHRRTSRYRISGNRRLWPASVTNDGQRTFIRWPPDASIPAVYSDDGRGHDVLVNGMMGTDDIYVIDGVPTRLTFRIDKATAHATRVAVRSKGR